MTTKEELFKSAVAFFNQNNNEEAEKICFEILKIDRFFADAYNILSAIYSNKNNLDKAIENIQHAININPNNHLYYTNLGEYYFRKGDPKKAEEYLLKAIAIKPDFSGARYNLGNVHKSQGRKADAKICYENAVALNKDDWQSLQNLGNLLKEEDDADLETVASYYWASIRVKPSNTEGEMALANCFYEMKNLYKAEFHYRVVLTKKPDQDQTIKCLAIIYELQSRYEEALKYFKMYLNNNKTNIARMFHVDFLEPSVYMHVKEIELGRKKKFEHIQKYIDMNLTLEKITSDWFIENVQPNLQLAYQGVDNKDFKTKYNEIFKNIFTDHYPTYKKNATDLIKVGYLVTDSHEGIFSRFNPLIINNLDKKFDQYLICSEKGYKKYIKEKITRDDINIIFTDGSEKDLKEKVRPLELDVLNHWEVGTDTLNYFAAYFKLALIQVTGLGFPETTGLPDMDYFISSELLELPNAQEHYTEKLIKFKNLPLVSSKVKIPEDYKSFEELGVDTTKNTYLCCQNLKKIHPDYDILVNKILERDPNGLFLFMESQYFQVTDLLRSRLKVTCAEFYDRIFFIEMVDNKDFLGCIKQADIIIDSLYFGGTTTAYDAFSMNTPVVTLPWEFERGRYTKALYDLMDIEGLVANSFDNLADIAVKTVNDKTYLKSLRDKIAEKNHILFENLAVVKEYEEFFVFCRNEILSR